MERRTVLISGGVAAAGLVAACSPGGGSSPDAASSVGSASSTSAAAPTSAQASSAVAGDGAGLATVSDIPVGGGVILAEPAIVVTQPEQGVVKAFTAICTHEGCLVAEVVDNEIICPCHGARFSAVDGAVLQGPAEQPLGEKPVILEGDSIVIG